MVTTDDGLCVSKVSAFCLPKKKKSPRYVLFFCLKPMTFKSGMEFETTSSDHILNKAADSTSVFGHTMRRSPLHAAM